MKQKVDVNWTEDMSFDGIVNGHKIIIDAGEKAGGKNRGPRPKALLLMALGGCTGMDVVSILRKMRVELEGLSIEVEGDLTEDHPKYFHTMLVRYRFKGRDLPMEKLEKAVSLSQERYCGVTAMLDKASKIEHEILIEN